MGKNVNDKKSNVAASDDDFDISKYLPEGYAADEFRKIGGLTPIYAAQAAYENKWPPCVGHINRIVPLDMGEEIKDMKQRIRPFLLVEVTHATNGVVGSGTEQETVEVAAGQEILVPMSGNIKNIKALHIAATDPMNVYLGLFRVVGQKQLNQPGKPSPMWEIDARLHSKVIPRTGHFTFAGHQGSVPELGGGVTSSGEVYDKDGVVVGQNVNVGQRPTATA